MKKLLLCTLLCATIIHANEHENESLMPDISVIMDMSYVNRNINNEEAVHLEAPGIAHGLLSSESHAGHDHYINNAKNGFNFNYAELLIDKEFEDILDFEAIFHFSRDKVEIDELFVSSEFMEDKLKIKAGKFRSNFGYLNQFHHHSYSFSDAPLVYETFLGMHGINETGLQLQLKVPTPFDLMIGFEVLEGKNEMMFGNDSMGLPTTLNGSTFRNIESTNAPSLYVSYAKSSFEIDDLDVHFGVSYAKGTSSINSITDEEPSAFSGSSSLYASDLLVKYHLHNHSILTWQSELIYREMKGDSYSYDGSNNLLLTPIDKKNAGFYTQVIYEYNENFNTGVRYENIYKNQLSTNLDKYSAMFTYSPIESMFFRLQYNRNNALYDESLNRKKIDTVILQANFTIGGHKAHKMHDEDSH